MIDILLQALSTPGANQKLQDCKTQSETLNSSTNYNKQSIMSNTLSNSRALIELPQQEDDESIDFAQEQQRKRQRFLSSVYQNKVIAQTRPIQHAYQTLPIKRQINEKYRTFMKWNYKDEFRHSDRRKKFRSLKRQKSDTSDVMNALMKFALAAAENEEKQKKGVTIEQLPGVKAERRQRFKKFSNPLMIIKHYIEKQDYKPSKQESALMEKVVKIKNEFENNISHFNLDRTLSDIYILMNTAVDYNQLRFLCLLVMLTAEICLEAKDFNRALYFYNQARIASTYADLLRIKADSILGMGKICLELKKYDWAIAMFKKSLQYFWKIKNSDGEVLVFDYLGKCYYYQGYIKKANYFHDRFIQCQLELNSSAVKKISMEMLGEYIKRVLVLEQTNLTSLFIEYLDLPIKGFNAYPPSKILSDDDLYRNYNQQGMSPRKNRPNVQFFYENFPAAADLIEIIFKKDFEFHTQIPSPTGHRLFVPQNKYGRNKKEIEYTQTSQYHKLVGIKPPALNLESVYKYPINIRIKKSLEDKGNPKWWENILSNTKKEQSQKIGKLRDRIFNSHESRFKYSDERRKAQSLKNEKIKESFNRTLLDFIDPQK